MIRFIFLFLFLVPNVGRATVPTVIGQKNTDQSDACSKHLQTSDINYSEFQKLVPGLRSKLFKNRNASLIELKPLIEELKLHFATVTTETIEEISSFPAEAQAKGGAHAQSATSDMLVEFVKIRGVLYEYVKQEIDLLIKHPELITYERYALLGYRAGIVMTRLPDTLNDQSSIGLVSFKIKQELNILGLSNVAPEEGVPDYLISYMKRDRMVFEKVTAAGPNHLYFWSLKGFTVENIVEAYDDQVSLGQLITKPNNFADNIDRNSDNFHFHDINHAYLYLEFDDELNWNSKIKTLAEFNRVLQKRKAFKDSVRKAIARVDSDPRIFNQLWYQIFHERPLEDRLIPFEPSLHINQSRLHKIIPTPKSVNESFKYVDLKFYTYFLSLQMKAHYGVSDERAKRMAHIAVENLLKVSRR